MNRPLRRAGLWESTVGVVSCKHRLRLMFRFSAGATYVEVCSYRTQDDRTRKFAPHLAAVPQAEWAQVKEALDPKHLEARGCEGCRGGPRGAGVP